MDRREFLEIASRLSAGVGMTSPLLKTSTATATGMFGENRADKGGGHTPIQQLYLPLDDDWTIATDPENIGREKVWFTTRQTHATATRVPSTIQQVFPYYHGVAWYWKEFTS